MQERPPLSDNSALICQGERSVASSDTSASIGLFLFFVDLVKSPACTCGGTLPTCCVAYTQQVDGELQPRAKTQ